MTAQECSHYGCSRPTNNPDGNCWQHQGSTGNNITAPYASMRQRLDPPTPLLAPSNWVSRAEVEVAQLARQGSVITSSSRAIVPVSVRLYPAAGWGHNGSDWQELAEVGTRDFPTVNVRVGEVTHQEGTYSRVSLEVECNEEEASRVKEALQLEFDSRVPHYDPQVGEPVIERSDAAVLDEVEAELQEGLRTLGWSSQAYPNFPSGARLMVRDGNRQSRATITAEGDEWVIRSYNRSDLELHSPKDDAEALRRDLNQAMYAEDKPGG